MLVVTLAAVVVAWIFDLLAGRALALAALVGMAMIAFLTARVIARLLGESVTYLSVRSDQGVVTVGTVIGTAWVSGTPTPSGLGAGSGGTGGFVGGGGHFGGGGARGGW